MEEKLKLGISSCLLGNKVRYDGGHKHDRYLTDVLGKFVEYVPVCPEYESGLGIPREAMRLVGDPEEPRLITQKTKIDHTVRMKKWIGPRLQELGQLELDGFIFKSGSPSSGMERIKVYDEKGNSRKNGVGLFARAFMDIFPLVPVEDEGRLHDIVLRENFIVRIFAYRRWKAVRNSRSGRSELIDFHARHKYLLMAHSPAVLKEMGRLVADMKKTGFEKFINSYEKLFMKALGHRATVKKHVNVLQHMAGYFKKMLSPDEKKELEEILELYRRELLPLIVPVTLISHYVRKYHEDYLTGQYYLEPHPVELKLRNHA